MIILSAGVYRLSANGSAMAVTPRRNGAARFGRVARFEFEWDGESCLDAHPFGFRNEVLMEDNDIYT